MNCIEHTRLYGDHERRPSPEFHAIPGPPTTAAPGSEEKKRVLAERVERGEELFAVGDPTCFKEIGLGGSIAFLIFPSEE